MGGGRGRRGEGAERGSGEKVGAREQARERAGCVRAHMHTHTHSCTYTCTLQCFLMFLPSCLHLAVCHAHMYAHLHGPLGDTIAHALSPPHLCVHARTDLTHTRTRTTCRVRGQSACPFPCFPCPIPERYISYQRDTEGGREERGATKFVTES